MFAFANERITPREDLSFKSHISSLQNNNPSLLCMIYQLSEKQRHQQCPHNSPSPFNTCVIAMHICVLICHTHTHTHISLFPLKPWCKEQKREREMRVENERYCICKQEHLRLWISDVLSHHTFPFFPRLPSSLQFVFRLFVLIWAAQKKKSIVPYFLYGDHFHLAL